MDISLQKEGTYIINNIENNMLNIGLNNCRFEYIDNKYNI